MFLKKFECSNYRSYGENAVFSFDKGLNTLIGENNSGKSNFVRAVDVVFNKLRNHTQIVSKAYTEDKDGIKYEIPSETPEFSDEEYHNKDTELNVVLKLVICVEENDDIHIKKFKNTFKGTVAARFTPTDKIDNIPDDAVKEIELIFDISHSPSIGNRSRQKSFMKFIVDKELLGINNPIVQIDKFLTSKYDFDKFTQLLKQLLVVFPEFRNKPSNSNISHITSSPSGTDLTSVLYNLKNSSNIKEKRKYDEIVQRFEELFHMQVNATHGPRLQFIRGGDSVFSIDGVGAGLIEVLNILTHIVSEENKIFIIEEPEMHLHPHGRRIMKKLLIDTAIKNQVIFITHSSDLIELNQIDKITLIRYEQGESKIFRLKCDYSDYVYMKKTLYRLTKSEQKEFFFARKVLLVEGDPEFGAFSVFGERLNYDFNTFSISVIPAGANYFVGLMRILHDFEIPFLVLCDSDVLMDISAKIKVGDKEIKTSSIFDQLNHLSLLSDDDKMRLFAFQKNIIRFIPDKWKKPATYNLLQALRDDPDMTEENKIRIESLLASREQQIEKYQYSDRLMIQELFNHIMERSNLHFKVLSSDFEGIFNVSDFKLLMAGAESLYGDNKVLQGAYLANNIPTNKIPDEVKDVISKLQSQ